MEDIDDYQPNSVDVVTPGHCFPGSDAVASFGDAFAELVNVADGTCNLDIHLRGE